MTPWNDSNVPLKGSVSGAHGHVSLAKTSAIIRIRLVGYSMIHTVAILSVMT